MNLQVVGHLVRGAGIALFGVFFLWTAVIGYYPTQVLAVSALAAAGIGLALGGQKMLQVAARERTEQNIAQRNAQEH